MAEDLWRDDPAPYMAALERTLTDVGAGYLYRVHLDVHLKLALPELRAAQVSEWYRAPALPRLAKAEPTPQQRDSGMRAARIFEALRGQLLGIRHAQELADGVTHNWYAHGLIEDRARIPVARAHLIGRLEAQGNVPPVPAVYGDHLGIADPQERLDVQWASDHAAEHVTRLRETTRHTVAQAITEALRNGEGASVMAVRLGSTFGTLNRDWRRVAVTELASARASGFLSGVTPGDRVTWKAAADACPVCAGLDGQVFRVGRGAGDGQKTVWPGKNNVGRSSARKRLDGTPRTEDEVWWPCIPLHPGCRCRYLRVGRQIAGVSPDLEAYLARLASS